MRFSLSTLAFAASLAFVNAQNLGNIPTCALSCFATAVPASGCSLTDTKCQCTTGRDAITSSVTSCVPDKCSAEDIAKVAPAVEELCADAGVTVSNLPTAVPSATSGSSNASRTSNVTGATVSRTAPAESTGGAVANVAGLGAVVLGVAAAFGL